MQNLTVILHLVMLVVFVGNSTAHAGIINLGSRATGGFGAPASGFQSMVLGWTFNGSGEAVEIASFGLIDLAGGGIPSGPDGTPLEIGVHVGFDSYTPLEEKDVDSGILIPNRPNGTMVERYGAVIGAFVPTAVAGDPGFQAFDEDLVAVGIDADALFFIGSLSTFVSTSAGSLYIGVNETFAINNGPGEFTVTIAEAAVPEPTTWTLIVTGLFGIIVAGKRRFQRHGR